MSTGTALRPRSIPTGEDLPGLARLAHGLAPRHCASCGDYHVMWPYLRSLGLHDGGPEHRFEDQRAIYAAAAGDRRTVRWLLAGSADAGQLALVGSVADLDPGVRHTVTIVDRCATPLAVARHHAATSGQQLETVLGDLMAFRAPAAFDVVTMHYLLNFFPQALRADFLRHAATWLAPQGRIIMAVTCTPDGVAPMRNEGVRMWREARIREAAASGALDLPEDIEIFVRRLDGMRESRGKEPRRSHDLAYYEQVILDAGLVIVDVVALPFDEEQRALHGASPRERCIITAALA